MYFLAQKLKNCFWSRRSKGWSFLGLSPSIKTLPSSPVVGMQIVNSLTRANIGRTKCQLIIWRSCSSNCCSTWMRTPVRKHGDNFFPWNSVPSVPRPLGLVQSCWWLRVRCNVFFFLALAWTIDVIYSGEPAGVDNHSMDIAGQPRSLRQQGVRIHQAEVRNAHVLLQRFGKFFILRSLLLSLSGVGGR